MAPLSTRLIRNGKQQLRTLCPQPLLNWREAQYYGKYGEVELHFLEFLCSSDRDSIDVGAAEGSYVHFMRRFSNRVYAFEPIPSVARELTSKFGSGVVIKNMALSSEAGMAVLHVPVIDGVLVPGCSSISGTASETYPGHREIRVPMEALDNIYSGDLGFIKIDVEGHEEAVLDGARNTIIRSQPRALVEIDDRLSPGATERIPNFFRALGYRGYFVYQRELLPIERFDRNIMQRIENLPDLTAGLEQRERFGRYIYNFLFFPSAEPPGTLASITDRLAEL